VSKIAYNGFIFKSLFNIIVKDLIVVIFG